MQKLKKLEEHHSKGKDKTKSIVVPLTGNRIQMRQSRSERIGQEKEEEIPNRHKRMKRLLRNNDMVNPLRSLDPEGSLP